MIASSDLLTCGEGGRRAEHQHAATLGPITDLLTLTASVRAYSTVVSRCIAPVYTDTSESGLLERSIEVGVVLCVVRVRNRKHAGHIGFDPVP